jgi:signal peptidase I
MDKLLKFGIVAAVAGAGMLAASAWIACGFVITTDAMAPKLHAGDMIFVNRLAKGVPNRGALMLIKVPDSEFQIVRRLIAFPGEEFKIENGEVFIDGKRLLEPYLTADDAVRGEILPPPIFYGPITVEEDGLFFLADTRFGELDCREFGSIKQERNAEWPPSPAACWPGGFPG